MNPAWKDIFDREGFLVLRNYFSAPEVAALEEGWLRFRRDIAPGLDRGHVMYEDPDDPETLKQADCVHREPGLDAFRHTGSIRELAEWLIGPVAPQHAEFFDKPPRCNKPTPPHQDGSYFCLAPNIACTVWIPLDDVDEENGALCYVPASHRLGLLNHGSSGVLGFSQGLTADPGRYGEAWLCAACPGDVLVHHSLTIHLAGANRSRHRHRRALGYVFYAASAVRDEDAWARYQESLRSQRAALGVLAASPPE